LIIPNSKYIRLKIQVESSAAGLPWERQRFHQVDLIKNTSREFRRRVTQGSPAFPSGSQAGTTNLDQKYLNI
jgi:hypothetical protein